MSATAAAASAARIRSVSSSKGAAVWLLGASVLAVIICANVNVGPAGTSVPVGETIRVAIDHIPLLRSIPHAPADATADALVWQIRLPRAIVACLVGGLLGLAGVALQGLLMNPLADPYTVGASSGAAVGAAMAEVLGVAALWSGFGGAGAAFVAAIGAVMLVYALARVGGRVSPQAFLLAGVIVGSCLWSLIPLLLVMSGRSNEVTAVLFHLIGTIQSADWTRAALLLPFAAVTGICLQLWSRELNLISLGEETAAHLGLEIEGFKRRVILIGSLATAAAVSVAGIIGFVGLVAPHVARRIIGPDHRALVPLAGLFGAILLLASDTVARAALGERLPVGVITSLIGAPLFCYLLRRSTQRESI